MISECVRPTFPCDRPVQLPVRTLCAHSKGCPEWQRVARCHRTDLHDPQRDQLWLRFVTGRPGSSITTQFLNWCCKKLAAQRKHSWLLIWDNARLSSQQKRADLDQRTPSCLVKQTGKGVRILPFQLPTKSPWLNPIERKAGCMANGPWWNQLACCRRASGREPHLCLLWMLL
jgi:hypothetical protein